LKGEERKVGAEVTRRFIEKCSKVGDKWIEVGPLVRPKSAFEYAGYFQMSEVDQKKLDEQQERAGKAYDDEAAIQRKRLGNAREKN
jgi:hypothetical protein